MTSGRLGNARREVKKAPQTGKEVIQIHCASFKENIPICMRDMKQHSGMLQELKHV